MTLKKDRVIQTGILNHVGNHLLDQLKRSQRVVRNYKLPAVQCVLKSENGTSCAIGCMIKDEYYSKELETWSPFDLKVMTAIGKSNDEWRAK